jgi:superfamily II DNA or RNA helicase
MTNSNEILLDIKSNLRFYQREALNAWVENSYQGILVMATGTGKTIVALSAIQLLKSNQQDLKVVIITVPKIHLAEQWSEALKSIKMVPIVCHSGNKKWEFILKRSLKIINKIELKSIIIVATLGTFISKRFQNYLIDFSDKLSFLICDEAHNVGTIKTRLLIPDQFCYRLALTATPERWFDEEGTLYIYKYFNKVVFTFSLSQAIEQRFLAPYNYEIIQISLSDKEYQEYDDKTIEYTIIKAKINQMKKGNQNVNKSEITRFEKKLQNIAITRRQIIINAGQKICEFSKLIKKFRNQNGILIYCSPQQFTIVGEILSSLGLIYRSLKYNNHKINERYKILKSFENGELPILVSMNILDEGINLPSISTAIFLSSSTNPKEFIQRRGRILRPAQNKNYAKIIDFVVINSSEREQANPSCDKNIYPLDRFMNSESNRVNEFIKDCMNKSDYEFSSND